MLNIYPLTICDGLDDRDADGGEGEAGNGAGDAGRVPGEDCSGEDGRDQGKEGEGGGTVPATQGSSADPTATTGEEERSLPGNQFIPFFTTLLLYNHQRDIGRFS